MNKNCPNCETGILYDGEEEGEVNKCNNPECSSNQKHDN